MPDFPVDAETIARAKGDVRRRLLAARRALTEAERAGSATAIQACVVATIRAAAAITDDTSSPWPTGPRVSTAGQTGTDAHRAPIGDPPHRPRPLVVAAYVPMPGEPGGTDLPHVLRAALPAGSRLLLPVLLPDNDLDWAEYTGTVRPGRLGLREPDSPRLGVDAVAAADLVLVPALAIDNRGIRLGRGGGSYDRALARLDPARTIALLHDGELLPEVPAAAHDRPVGAVVTPSGGLRPTEWTK
ncbi:5-formyltetrahydrofolate cyclo-ligase [Spirilliplanes yamanashiensis]|uniref:5-formyltetrahydrofolate cyclo-ligase n=1 Tax=Spirilliplanes yamanashiensis TaxID=42233 RepID=A0A8J4DGL9_9ACTN|nr:5-formyltetrahydrofolate cyclo-ligase [Spirilliplanes yamanashiensis]MDP9814254.1 5-formyltetrahydrofolate cyclo-ligase [Spirilliplanes yamanashiensis]GIJ00763.1 hypothetical protein Sya03_01150 [Spirilliplanes yamanashiensis]